MLLPFVQVAKSEKRKARKHAKLHADSRIIRRRPDRTFLQLGARAQILVDRNPKKRRLRCINTAISFVLRLCHWK